MNHDVFKGGLSFMPDNRERIKKACKNSIFFTNLKPNILPDRKNTKEFSKTIDNIQLWTFYLVNMV